MPSTSQWRRRPRRPLETLSREEAKQAIADYLVRSTHRGIPSLGGLALSLGFARMEDFLAAKEGLHGRLLCRAELLVREELLHASAQPAKRAAALLILATEFNCRPGEGQDTPEEHARKVAQLLREMREATSGLGEFRSE